MIKADDKHEDRFWWGKAEQYHLIVINDKKFKLLDVVTVTKNCGRSYKGQIGFIYEDSMDFLIEHGPAQKIKFCDIKDITY